MFALSKEADKTLKACHGASVHHNYKWCVVMHLCNIFDLLVLLRGFLFKYVYLKIELFILWRFVTIFDLWLYRGYIKWESLKQNKRSLNTYEHNYPTDTFKPITRHCGCDQKWQKNIILHEKCMFVGLHVWRKLCRCSYETNHSHVLYWVFLINLYMLLIIEPKF